MIPGGFKVCDANGQSLAYVYSRENRNVRQQHLFSNSRRRELPFPLADLLGHDGVYFALLMSCPLWVINRHPAMSAARPLYLR
jgi:hypothetical protein